MKTISYAQPNVWENSFLMGRNQMESYVSLIPFQNMKAALHKKKQSLAFYAPLNGT